MKSILLFAAFCLSAITLFSQEIKWGNPQKAKSDIAKVITFDNEDFVTTINRTLVYGGLSLVYYKNFAPVAEGNIEDAVPEGKAEIIGVERIGSVITAFLHYRGNRLSKFYYQTYSEECIPVSQPVEILQFEIPEKLMNYTSVEVITSENHDFAALEYTAQLSKEEKEFRSYILNSSFGKVASGEFVSHTSPTILSDQGHYFICSGTGKIGEDKFLNINCLVGEQKIEAKIPFDSQKYMDAVSLFEDEKGLLHILGLTGFKGATGMFYLKANPVNGELLTESYKDFSHEFLAEGLSNSQSAKKDLDATGIEDLFYASLHTLSDGSITAIFESNEYSFFNNTSHYTYGDLLILSVNDEGQMNNPVKVRKKQETLDNTYYCSFSSYTDQDKLHIFFGDGKKNYDESGNFISKSNSDLASMGTKAAMVGHVIVIPGAGNVTRKKAFQNEEGSISTAPKMYCYDSKNKNMLVFLENGGKEKFGRMK